MRVNFTIPLLLLAFMLFIVACGRIYSNHTITMASIRMNEKLTKVEQHPFEVSCDLPSGDLEPDNI